MARDCPQCNPQNILPIFTKCKWGGGPPKAGRRGSYLKLSA
jgi:hypothetical protein